MIEFWYAPDGERIRKSVTQNMTTTTVQYVVDSQQAYAQVVLELDGAGAITAKYCYGDDLLKVSRNGEYYYFYDSLGSTRIITDATGAVKNRYTYSAFGSLLAGEVEATVPNEYLFTGERVDADTGLVYLRARYYDPATGRFAQIDSVLGTASDPSTLHRYLYTGADPVNRIDPGGHTFSLSGVMTTVANIARIGAQVYSVYSRIMWAVQIANWSGDAIEILGRLFTAQDEQEIEESLKDLGELAVEVTIESALQYVMGKVVQFGFKKLQAWAIARRVAHNRVMGQKAEDYIANLYGYITHRVKFATGLGYDVIADHVDDVNHLIREVKNRKRVDNTKQMRGLVQVAINEGKQIVLHVRSGTEISSKLLKALNDPHPSMPGKTIGQIVRDIPDSLAP